MLPNAFAAVLLSIMTFPSSIPGLPTSIRLTILQNHPIDDFSTQDASPSRKLFIRAVEPFVDHDTTATMALHTTPLR
jgi:hypothetical protein